MSACPTINVNPYKYDEAGEAIMLRTIQQYKIENRALEIKRLAILDAQLHAACEDKREAGRARRNLIRIANLGKQAQIAIARRRDWSNVPTISSRRQILNVDALPKWARVCYAAACEEYGVAPRELTRIYNSGKVVAPRHLAMFLMVRVAEESYHKAALCLGGVHHTTVIHGVRTVERKRLADPELNLRVERAQIVVECRLHIGRMGA
jgi:chromosomal replication initiation ATPase DnaA